MSEDLQPLLQKIQREGIDKARTEADALLEKARAEAHETLEKARTEAESLRESARRDAEAFDARARESLKQAGRDLVLTVEQRIIGMLRRLLDREVAAVLEGNRLGDLVVAAVKSHLQSDQKAKIEILLPPAQVEALRAHVLGKLREDAGEGQIIVSADERLGAGFSLRLDNGRIEHDFSAAAITDVLAGLLRPGLRELLRDGSPE